MNKPRSGRVRRLSRHLRGTDISRAQKSGLNTEEPTLFMNYSLIQIPNFQKKLSTQKSVYC